MSISNSLTIPSLESFLSSESRQSLWLTDGEAEGENVPPRPPKRQRGMRVRTFYR